MTIQPVLTFHKMLLERDNDLYYKWWHGQFNKTDFTNSERDIIQGVARQARIVTNYKGE